MISTKGRYAIRLMLDLAMNYAGEPIRLKDVAQRQNISEKYLESIVKLLVKGGVLTGIRGKGGGYRLNSAPEQIRIGQILLLTEGTLSPVACLTEGASPCERMAECRTRSMWQGLDQVIQNYLNQYTLSDLLAGSACDLTGG